MELPSTHCYAKAGPFYTESSLPDGDAVCAVVTNTEPCVGHPNFGGWGGGQRFLSKKEIIAGMRAQYALQCGWDAAHRAYGRPDQLWSVQIAPEKDAEIAALKAEMAATKTELAATKTQLEEIKERLMPRKGPATPALAILLSQ